MLIRLDEVLQNIHIVGTFINTNDTDLPDLQYLKICKSCAIFFQNLQILQTADLPVPQKVLVVWLDNSL